MSVAELIAMIDPLLEEYRSVIFAMGAFSAAGVFFYGLRRAIKKASR